MLMACCACDRKKSRQGTITEVCNIAGDEIELRAISDVFGAADTSTAVSSTKGATGVLMHVRTRKQMHT